MTDEDTRGKKPRSSASWRKKLAALAFAGAACAGAVTAEHHVNAPSDAQVTAAAGIPSAACLHDLTQAFNDQSSLAHIPSGNGRPVIVIPGFLNNDAYMSPLREKIGSHGYKVYGWEEGFNTGPDGEKAKLLAARLKDVYEDNGRVKVSLVGYSLGGVYARELARAYPEMVENVVVLGAPIGLVQKDGAPDPRVAQIRGFYHAGASPLHPPPLSAIFSPNDHIVGWRASLAAPSASSENIPVAAGHIAMPFSDETAAVILDRLGQKSDSWQPAARKKCGPGASGNAAP